MKKPLQHHFLLHTPSPSPTTLCKPSHAPDPSPLHRSRGQHREISPQYTAPPASGHRTTWPRHASRRVRASPGRGNGAGLRYIKTLEEHERRQIVGLEEVAAAGHRLHRRLPVAPPARASWARHASAKATCWWTCAIETIVDRVCGERFVLCCFFLGCCIYCGGAAVGSFRRGRAPLGNCVMVSP